MPGLGSTPLGGSNPYGVSAPVSATQPPEDPPKTAAYIDPQTGDYTLDSEGELNRMPVNRQRVLLAMADLDRPKRMGTNFERVMAGRVRARLRFMTHEEESIRITAVTVKRTPGKARITISYTDVDAAQPDAAEFEL